MESFTANSTPPPRFSFCLSLLIILYPTGCHIVSRKPCYDSHFQGCHIVSRDSRRDRAPSRIPAKRISRVLCKTRSVRRLVRRYIKKEIPRSSHVHRLLCASSHERKQLLSDRVMYLPHASFMKHKLLKVYDLKCRSRSKRIPRTKKMPMLF